MLKHNLLVEVVASLKQKHNLTPCIGAEIEFYLYGKYNLNLLEQKINLSIKKEKGTNQFEINLPPSQNIEDYAQKIAYYRGMILYEAEKYGYQADFTSKPFPDDYGNSMHIHLSFLEDTNIDKYAEILCHFLPKTIKCYLPKKEDLLRLDSKFMAPTHISYGNNNRTTMIRIPDAIPKRLEHRLAAASANPYDVIYAILQSINQGLETPDIIKPLDKIYGNAFDPQYKLTKINKFW